MNSYLFFGVFPLVMRPGFMGMILLVFISKISQAQYMSRQNNVKHTTLIPSNLKDTLVQLEGTLAEWEKISPDGEPETSEESRFELDKEALEKELQKKARIILNQLKDQIEELSE